MKEKTVILDIVKDTYASNQDTLFNSYVSTKYKLGFDDLKISSKDIDNVINKVKLIDKNIKQHDFDFSLFYKYIVLESDDFLLSFAEYDNKKKIQISFYFNSYEESHDIFKIIEEYRDDEDELFINISSFYKDAQGSISYTDSRKTLSEYKNNSLEYYPFLRTEEMFKQFSISDSNILMLCGDPGTGKTRLGDAYMRYMLEEAKLNIIDMEVSKTNIVGEKINENDGIRVAYIKNEDILSNDIFWNILKEEEFHIVFLDDLDYSLIPRTQNISTSEDIQKNKFISNLLSFTDGIFESGNKTKFIVTSNRSVKDIDTAILRKGRTFDILNLRQLTKVEALKIWEYSELPIEIFEEEFESNKVLQADLGSSISMNIKAREMDIDLVPYIKEAGISIYNEYTHPTSFGI